MLGFGGMMIGVPIAAAVYRLIKENLNSSEEKLKSVQAV